MLFLELNPFICSTGHSFSLLHSVTYHSQVAEAISWGTLQIMCRLCFYERAQWGRKIEGMSPYLSGHPSSQHGALSRWALSMPLPGIFHWFSSENMYHLCPLASPTQVLSFSPPVQLLQAILLRIYAGRDDPINVTLKNNKIIVIFLSGDKYCSEYFIHIF